MVVYSSAKIRCEEWRWEKINNQARGNFPYPKITCAINQGV